VAKDPGVEGEVTLQSREGDYDKGSSTGDSSIRHGVL
jgi:hypothetical protein